MNSRGFGVLPIVVGCIVLLVVVLAGMSALNQRHRSQQADQIDQEITGLNLPYDLLYKKCNAGDGVDSGAQCTFRYSGSATEVAQALEKGGYTLDSSGLSAEGGGVEIGTLRGGSPAVMIMLNGDKRVTSLEVTRNN